MLGFLKKIKDALSSGDQPLQPKADFIIVGTQKAGTSLLRNYLVEHPEIGMPTKKELHFFDDDKQFSKSKPKYKRFVKRFDFSDGKKVYGEATPIYMYWDPAIGRIKEYNPHMKLLVLLRDPSERTFAHWSREIEREKEKHDFLPALNLEKERLNAVAPLQDRVFSYTDRSFYSRQIRRIRSYFPAEQVMFIKFEDFIAQQEETLKQVFDFLGVDPDKYSFELAESIHKPLVRSITQEERARLVNLFKRDIEEVEKALNWTCSDWKNPKVSNLVT